jgi:hypothetical protein
MKSIKHHLLGLLLAVCAMASASATPTLFTDTFFVPGDMSGSGTGQTYTFAGGDPSAHAGDSFLYDFLFNTPPPNAGFSFLASADDPAALMFSGIGLFAGDQVTPLFGLNLTLTDSMVSGWGVLDSGVYDLRLSGNFLADAGSFSGGAMADPAYVPEPASLALLLVGVLAIAAVRRRGRAPQARAALAAC